VYEAAPSYGKAVSLAECQGGACGLTLHIPATDD
jgi:hypothetical protein